MKHPLLNLKVSFPGKTILQTRIPFSNCNFRNFMILSWDFRFNLENNNRKEKKYAKQIFFMKMNSQKQLVIFESLYLNIKYVFTLLQEASIKLFELYAPFIMFLSQDAGIIVAKMFLMKVFKVKKKTENTLTICGKSWKLAENPQIPKEYKNLTDSLYLCHVTYLQNTKTSNTKGFTIYVDAISFKRLN